MREIPSLDAPWTRRRLLGSVGAGTAAMVAGCATDGDTTTPTSEEGTVTVRLRNRDSVDREYTVVVRQGDSLRDEFSGVLPPGQRIEMIATFRITDAQYEFRISAEGGQRGRTWDPRACASLLVDAFIENGAPGFETGCQGPDSNTD